MAVDISKKDDGTVCLKFIRGDSCPLKFKINDVEENTVLKTSLQSLYLTCRESNSKYSEIIFQKDIDDFDYENDYYFISIKSKDTRELPYGTYNFDIQATFADGEVQTLKGEFILTDEDTIYEGG